jgi:cyclophilin family peptidyl-prolyl cis-trans isomerase/HEAT repeat protein
MVNRGFYNFILILTGFSILLSYQSCVPSVNDKNQEIQYSIRDSLMQEIVGFQDSWNFSQLYPLLHHSQSDIRQAAALAFSSANGSWSIDSLSSLLRDPSAKVRAAAAYSLGQSKNPDAENILIAAFENNDSLDIYSRSNAAILEAMGKTAKPSSLEYLTQIKTYKPNDQDLLLGQCRGIYRFALRDIISPEGTARMIEIATNGAYADSIRVIAANYLHRAREIDLEPHLHFILNDLKKEDNPYIRMTLASALGKAKSSRARDTLMSIAQKDSDYRVRCNAIRALEDFPYNRIKRVLLDGVEDKNPHVAFTAANSILKVGEARDANGYRALARKTSLPTRIRAVLFKAAQKNLPPAYAITKKNLNGEIIEMYSDKSDPYDRVYILDAMSADGRNFDFLKEKYNQNSNPVVKTAAMSAMTSLVANDRQNVYFSIRKACEFFQEEIQKGNPSTVALISATLSEWERAKYFFKDTTELMQGLDKLSLPADIESYNELGKFISSLTGSTFEVKETGFNHPISWDLLDQISDSVIVEFETTKGAFTVRLWTNHAPGTVLNFVKLIQLGFYERKFFHRVVPNFVIQGGCPNGDGYGALDYTIRSELGPAYYDSEGYIGMASSGNHTESTQFFITHSPTPHLDGRYTIFGKVISGMDVVHDIQVGDKIIKLRLLN